MLKKRKLGPFEVSEVGLGCMNLSHAYGEPPAQDDAVRLIERALDLGVTHFDSAALYGFGRNEELVGAALKKRHGGIVLASKCGMQGIDGKRVIDGRPATLRRTLDDSLRQLQREAIDLYYLHRFDKLNGVPIEDSVGELSRMVEDGKVRAIGLSEVSAAALLKAHAVHPIAAVQSEYSLWSRNAEIAVLDTCRAIGAAFVAFSPIARGFLAAGEMRPANFAAKDIRRGMPRFQSPHFERNCALLPAYREIAREARCAPTQLAIAWLLHKAPHVIPIPGTTSIAHLEEDIGAASVSLSPALIEKLDALINDKTVSGPRYPAATQAEVDTEEFEQ